MSFLKKLSLFGALLLVQHSPLSAQTAKHNLNIVFIGNSITHGSGLPDPLTQAPPVIAAQELRSVKGMGTVQFSNAGRSGSTTLDWLPENQKLFLTAEQAAAVFAADTSATLLFSIVLGTNDSAIKGPHGAPVSAGNYHINIMKIADRLLSAYPGCMIIFQYPT